MTQQGEPVSAGAESVEMGTGARLYNFFLGSPTRAVESLRARVRWTDWVVPLLVTFIVTSISGRLTKDIVLSEIKDRIRSSTVLTDEQVSTALERIEQQQEKYERPGYMILGYGISLVGLLLITAVVGGVILFITNVILGGEAQFLHAFSLAAWGSWLTQFKAGAAIMGLFPGLVKTPLILAKGSTDVATSLAVLLPESMKARFLYQFADKFDIFTIWQLALMSMGVAVLARVTTRKAAAWVVGLWLIVAILGSLISTFLMRAQGLAG